MVAINPEEKYKYWETKAIYDLETSKAMLKAGRYMYVAFMSQQSIEKLVKGLFVLYMDKEPLRTHNIWAVFKELIEVEKFKGQAQYSNSKVEEYKPFFADLLFYYISERYPDYKQQLSSNIQESKAEEILTKTEEVFIWLQSLSQLTK